MTTTWPRYRNIESDDCGQCSYSQYQPHSCGTGHQQPLGQPGGHGGYPSDTYPRQGPQCCQVEVTRGHQGHHQEQYNHHQQLPSKSSKSEKRERREREREHREREHRDREKEQRREQRERERQQQQQTAEQQHHQQQQQPPSEPLVPDCVDCAAAAAATHQSLPVTNGSGPPVVSSNMQVDMGPYRGAPEASYQGQAGGKRERDGVESGYSTQNRDERDKERPGPGQGDQGAGGDKKEKEKVNKTEQDQIQYIEGEGCQVWRPQVMLGFILFFDKSILVFMSFWLIHLSSIIN